MLKLCKLRGSISSKSSINGESLNSNNELLLKSQAELRLKVNSCQVPQEY
jgi:hypothetical protein